VWHIQRIRPYPEGPAVPDCASGSSPVEIILKSDADGSIVSVGHCMSTTPGDQPCDMLRKLRTAGFTPADWDDECPPV
jgi:hypothetical protein